MNVKDLLLKQNRVDLINRTLKMFGNMVMRMNVSITNTVIIRP
jgi:hypothetical protein